MFKGGGTGGQVNGAGSRAVGADAAFSSAGLRRLLFRFVRPLSALAGLTDFRVHVGASA